MAKKESPSRKYLRVLGIISIVLACIVVFLGILSIAIRSQFSLADIGMTELANSLGNDITEDTAKVIIGVSIIISGALQFLIAWLLIRAANDPKKSTFLFVLLILEVISGIYALISAGFASAGTATANIVNLTVYVLATICTYSARREVEA